jgi:hypothetical protein
MPALYYLFLHKLPSNVLFRLLNPETSYRRFLLIHRITVYTNCLPQNGTSCILEIHEE